jgi:tRNA pseudouridine38-40 synthase
VPVRLEHEHMREAAQALVGRHDFTSFRSSECQAPSPVKTLDLIDVRDRRRGDRGQAEARGRSCTTRSATSWAR